LRTLKPCILSYIAIFICFQGFSQEDDLSKADLARINRELDNPLASYWSLVFQENYAINSGNIVDGNVSSNTFFFQPALPIPIGDKLMFTARPVFPLVTQPNLGAEPAGSTSTTGFGDMQLASFIGPGNATGWVWGIGATFVFPTASSDMLGQGKYQAGPALMLFHLGKQWNKGVFIQHWWSYAGDEARNNVVVTDFQYVVRKTFGASSLGMGPSIRVDWTKSFDEALTFPIGLGYTRTVKFGKTPIKLRIEPQYSLIRPSSYGTVWNIRIQLAPVLQSPFKTD